MCDICLQRVCPAACPSHVEREFVCANCDEDVYEYEVAELLDDGTCLCSKCVAFVEDTVLDAVRVKHSRPLIEQIKRRLRV